MEEQIKLICEDSIDGIFTAIYHAWIYHQKGHKVSIGIGQEYNYEWMVTYVPIDTDYVVSKKVSDSIEKKISLEVYQMVIKAAVHYAPDRANAIFGFLQLGFSIGKNVIHQLQEPYVMRVYELARKAGNEARSFMEFIRFLELKNGILFSEIEPKCNVLPLLGEHFSQRYSIENWVIYDEKRKQAILHPKNQEWYIVEEPIREKMLKQVSEKQEEIADLWQLFFETIGIEGRKNMKCQNNMFPKWYRKHVTEFNGK